jgi:hypothetical protein
MGFFKWLRGEKEAELLAQSSPVEPAQPQPHPPQQPQVFTSGTVTTKVIDLSDQPEARAQVLGAMEQMTGQDLDGDGKIGGGDTGPVAELERLTKLHAGGALTDEEFAEAKRRVLGC